MDVAVTFDLDNISCNNVDYEINNVSFNYKLNSLYEYLYKTNINQFTAFVRIDNQIKNLFGNYLHLLDTLPKTPEIGWHPHCYLKKDKYYQQFDTEQIIRELWEIYPHVPKEIKMFRMGGAFMNSKIMSQLELMNLNDSSALPGCFRKDQHRQYDWTITGNTSYYPCIDDHRCTGSNCFRIKEIPMTTIPIFAPYGTKRRCVNPTIKSSLFQPAFSACSQFLTNLVIVFHPDQLIDGYEDDLYLYGMNNFTENMNFIRSEIDINFKRISCL